MAEPCVSNEKVIQSFVLSEKLKDYCESNSFDKQLLLQKILEFQKELSGNQNLLPEIKDINRQQRFSNAIWYRKNVALEQCWVWPHMGQNQNAFKTVPAAVSAFQNCGKKIAKFRGIQNYLSIFEQECPLIVFAAPGIHGSYREFRGNFLEYYDIDDGNHRAIAAFLAGKKYLPAFVGFLKK